jgi:uncharacterized protein YbjT (DUF2867 family)
MILVTRATGHVGKELVPQLLEIGQPVRVLVRDERKVAHLGEQVECIVGDLGKPETLAAAMAGVDGMFLVTMSHGTQHDINAVEAAKRAGVKHVVKLSTLEASRLLGQVGRWHREKEMVIVVFQ